MQSWQSAASSTTLACRGSAPQACQRTCESPLLHNARCTDWFSKAHVPDLTYYSCSWQKGAVQNAITAVYRYQRYTAGREQLCVLSMPPSRRVGADLINSRFRRAVDLLMSGDANTLTNSDASANGSQSDPQGRSKGGPVGADQKPEVEEARRLWLTTRDPKVRFAVFMQCKCTYTTSVQICSAVKPVSRPLCGREILSENCLHAGFCCVA